MYEETQRIRPKEQTQFRKRKLNDADLSDSVKENPSVMLQQIAEHFSVRLQSIRMQLKQLGMTLKKHSCIKNEMKNTGDNSQKRAHG